MNLLNFFIVLLAITFQTSNAFTSREVKCHVCKATVQEMENAIAKVDPKKIADVSGFRLDAQGNSVTKTKKLVKSEMYLTELMEQICGKMEDYAKATYKKTGKFTLIKMIVNGSMNDEASKVDFVQDGDLNKSLEHFCLEILDSHEEDFLKAFQSDEKHEDLDIQICSLSAKYCDDAPTQEDYTFDEYKEEL